MKAEEVRQKLKNLANPEIAEHSQRFFKTGPGEYGEGDRFLGIRVPEQRKLAKQYIGLSLEETQKLLRSDFHEERLTSLLILVYKFPKATDEDKERIYRFYINNLEYINNWDLIDSSAPKIMGAWLIDKPKEILYEMAKSENLWERRIVIMATAYFIHQNQFEDTLQLADILLQDEHDLIHKAAGWMLREVGKKDQSLLEDFLKDRYSQMPRTMLRYAIEKLPESLRKSYLEGRI